MSFPSHFSSRATRGLVLMAALTAAHGLTQAQGVASGAAAPRNVVSLSATATQDINQDLLAVSLSVTRDGSQAAEVQSQLKQVLEAALTEARKEAKPGSMEVRTGHFSMYPRYNTQGKINGWQGSAQLVLEGTDMPRIAQVAGKLTQLNVTGWTTACPGVRARPVNRPCWPRPWLDTAPRPRK